MIKFFRKIRQNMIKENKVSKYMLYAIGEIVLVVIGILIALQINNSNESKKTRIYEVKMLAELKHTLESDVKYFERMKDRMQRLDSSTTVFINLAYKKSIYIDSIFLNEEIKEILRYRLRIGVAYKYNSGPYEAIKSSGMDKISNDSLRNLLVKFYDFDLPRHKELTEWAHRGYENDLAQINSFQLNSIIEERDGELEVINNFTPDLLQRPRFIKLLGNLRRRARSVNQHIEYIIPDMKNVKTLIDREIQK